MDKIPMQVKVGDMFYDKKYERIGYVINYLKNAYFPTFTIRWFFENDYTYDFTYVKTLEENYFDDSINEHIVENQWKYFKCS